MHRTTAGPGGPTLAEAGPTRPRQTTTRAPAPADRSPTAVEGLETRRLFQAGPLASDPFGAVRADGNDLAIDAGGGVHRVWRDRDTHALLYARRNGDQTWTGALVVDPSPVGINMSLAIDPTTARPAVAYYDRVSGNLKYASMSGGSWTAAQLDQPGDVGDYPSLVFTSLGKQYISYYDRTNGDLKWAFQFGPDNAWGYATADAGLVGADVGMYSSIIEGPRRAVMIAYGDKTNGTLRLASLANGSTTWTHSVIDSGMPAGVTDVQLASGVGGVPLVSYRDAQFKRLKTAFQQSPTSWLKWQLPAGDNGEYASMFFANATPYVLHNDRVTGMTEVVMLGEPDTRPKRIVAYGGEHLEAATDAGGQLIFNRVDPATGLLRTSSTRHAHHASTDPAQRVIQWETIGGATNDASKRRVGWDIDRNGWQGYVNGRVAQLRALGMRRILMHNPFGTLPGEDFQFDQYIHAQEMGLTWLTNGFVQAWKPVTDAGVEVICYIGKLAHDVDFTSLTDLQQYMARVKRSLQPMIDAGCSIGLDSIVGNDFDSREYMVAEMLRQSGVKVYNENRPPRDFTWWHNFGGVYYDDGFLNSQPHVSPDLQWAATNDLLKGEILRYTGNPPPGSVYSTLGWRAPDVMRILADGHTAATDIAFLRAEGYTLQRVMRAASSPVRDLAGGGTISPELATTSRATVTGEVLEPGYGGVFGQTLINTLP